MIERGSAALKLPLLDVYRSEGRASCELSPAIPTVEGVSRQWAARVRVGRSSRVGRERLAVHGQVQTVLCLSELKERAVRMVL